MGGTRLTPYRAAVLETLRASHTHPSATELFLRVRRRCPRVSCATIYNALAWLLRQGLITELKSGDGASRYDPITRRHDHLLCTCCGALLDSNVELPPEIVSRAGRHNGFHVEGYRLEMLGICPRCATNHRRRAAG